MRNLSSFLFAAAALGGVTASTALADQAISLTVGSNIHISGNCDGDVSLSLASVTTKACSGSQTRNAR